MSTDKKEETFHLMPAIYTAIINSSIEQEKQALLEYEVKQKRDLAKFKIENSVNHTRRKEMLTNLVGGWWRQLSSWRPPEEIETIILKTPVYASK